MARHAVKRNGRTSAGAIPRDDSGTDPAIAENVRVVSRFEHGGLQERSLLERLADAVAGAAGSSWSLLAHGVLFSAWLLVNARWIPHLPAFDPPPFGLLTTIVSLEAIFLSLFILTSQNRMSRQAERREHLDLQINLLAEQESSLTLKLLRRLCERQGIPIDEETRELEKKTNIRELIDRIDEHVPKS
jgi:uncharacterized membrane protein